jgi:Regulator of chromosome condensation (RCC1) repeat
VTAVAGSGLHTCALTVTGSVLCWGYNGNGELGDGTTTPRPTPVAVSSLSSGVTAIAVGGAHTCALTRAGAVLCWGINDHGELGDGSTTERLTPVAVSGLSSGVTAIATGDQHVCALTSAGGVLCWGANVHGALGDGTTTERLTPVAVSGLSSGVTAIGAGGLHTCALTSAGGVLCWGANVFGAVGDGSTTDRDAPVSVSGLSSGVTALAVGEDHTCALTSAGGALCWGDNEDGDLGDGTATDRDAPVSVSGLSSGVIALAAGRHTCALTSAGGVLCWGNNDVGELGDGTTAHRPTPVAVSGLRSGVTAVSASADGTCALTSAGGVVCWGDNMFGQLGDGTTTERLTPVHVSGT